MGRLKDTTIAGTLNVTKAAEFASTLKKSGKEVATEHWVENNFSPNFEITSNTTGAGNAVTAVSVDPTDKTKLNITKGLSFLTSNTDQEITGVKTFSAAVILNTYGNIIKYQSGSAVLTFEGSGSRKTELRAKSTGELMMRLNSSSSSDWENIATEKYVNDTVSGMSGGGSVVDFTSINNALKHSTGGLRLGLNSGGSGSYNTAIGDSALKNATSGTNTALGFSAGESNTSGQFNTFIGYATGRNVTTNSNNTFVGDAAGRYYGNGFELVNVRESTYIGSGAKGMNSSTLANHTNEIVIGYNALGKGSNTVQLGNTSTTEGYIGSNKIATENYVDTEIENISLTPGPQGPQGVPGADGSTYPHIFAFSSTAQGTTAKVASATSGANAFTDYQKGQLYTIEFSTGNTATTPTININSKGAKTVRHLTTNGGTTISPATNILYSRTRFLATFVYDGTYMIPIGVANRYSDLPTALPGYSKPGTEPINPAISVSDSLITALGKLEYKVDNSSGGDGFVADLHTTNNFYQTEDFITIADNMETASSGYRYYLLSATVTNGYVGELVHSEIAILDANGYFFNSWDTGEFYMDHGKLTTIGAAYTYMRIKLWGIE